MSRLQELIDDLCPNGVEYIEINDLMNSLTTGLNPRKNFVLNEQGATQPYITGKDVFNNTVNISDKTDKIKPEVVELINKRAKLQDRIILFASTGTGTVGRMAYIEKYDGSWNISETLYVINLKWELIVPRYFMYVVNSSFAKEQYEPKISKGSVPHLKIADLVRVRLPLPPIEVQEEIVNILDKYTNATEDLKSKLAEELKARKNQYDYYRNDLINRANAERIALGDLCYIKARIGWQRLTKSEYLEHGDYYLVTGVNIRNNRIDFDSCWYVSEERYKMDENIQLRNGDIILTKDGTIGKVALIENMNKPAVLNSHLFVIRDELGKLNHRYLLHCLLSKDFTKFVDKNKTQGTIPGLNQATMIKYMVPVPSIEEQEKIADILDRFDMLCNGICEKITEEIEALQKQYEYYRDSLFIFKELGAN